MITETKTRQVEGDITIFEIAGRLSLGNTLMSVESAVKRLIEGGSRRMVLEVSNLEFIDSAGIGTLLSCAGQMEKDGGRMRIAGAKGRVKHAFEIVHLDRVAPIDPDIETACQTLRADAAAR
jgi:anti-sigma B factor antagonist